MYHIISILEIVPNARGVNNLISPVLPQIERVTEDQVYVYFKGKIV